MNINDRIREAMRERDSLLCIGLDVDRGKIPSHLLGTNDPVFAFNKQIIDATADLVLAYKPNLAFYESLGAEGWEVLKRTVAYIPENVIKIGDAKRGDIGSTAQKYAEGLFALGFDMVTVNPYLGWDSIAPFVKDEGKGVFILCLTSNPSSRDFQYIVSEGRTLFQRIAETAVRWNKKGNCGLVVGATHPDELVTIRGIAPELPFLVPGIGAQGGDLEASVSAGTDTRGEMAVINSSRGIIYASPGKDFAEAARREAMKLRDAINRIRKNKKITTE